MRHVSGDEKVESTEENSLIHWFRRPDVSGVNINEIKFPKVIMQRTLRQHIVRNDFNGFEDENFIDPKSERKEKQASTIIVGVRRCQWMADEDKFY